MTDISKDGLLLGGGIRHITATQAEVKKFLLVYVILFQLGIVSISRYYDIDRKFPWLFAAQQ